VSTAPRPSSSTALHMRNGLRSALAAAGVKPYRYGAYVLVCVEGTPLALAFRAALVASLRKADESLALLLAQEAVRPGWLATIRLPRSRSTRSAVVGQIRVMAREGAGRPT
jgi:hypothetical protein